MSNLGQIETTAYNIEEAINYLSLASDVLEEYQKWAEEAKKRIEQEKEQKPSLVLPFGL